MKPASATRRGRNSSTVAARAASNSSRLAKCPCSTTRVATPRAAASSRPLAPATLLITADTGRPASSSACMLLPLPEISTTITSALSRARRGHRLGSHPPIEVLPLHVTQGERRLAQGAALAMRLLRDFGRTVVADVRCERRDQHQRALEQI